VSIGLLVSDWGGDALIIHFLAHKARVHCIVQHMFIFCIVFWAPPPERTELVWLLSSAWLSNGARDWDEVADNLSKVGDGEVCGWRDDAQGCNEAGENHYGDGCSRKK